MRYSFLVGVLVCCLVSCSLKGSEPSDELFPDQELSETTIESICETKYVGEVLELCKDCDIAAPEVREPWVIEVWMRSLAIAGFYKYYAFKTWLSNKLFGAPQAKNEA